jgi:hypothetical protein
VGDRTRDQDRTTGDAEVGVDVDKLAVPSGSLLEKLLADRRMGPIVLKRIAARKKRLAAEAKDPLRDQHRGERVYHEHQLSGGLERKPNSDITDAKVSVGLGVEHHERDGGTETVDERKAQLSLSKADGLGLQSEHSEALGNEEAGTKSGNSLGVQIAPGNGHVKVGHESSAWSGEDKQKTAYDASLGLKDGKLDAEIAHALREDSATGATENKQSLGYKEGRAEVGLGRTHIDKHEDGTESSKGRDLTVGVGKDSAAVTASQSKTNAQGTTSKTALGGEWNWNEGNASVNASHTVTTKGGDSATVGGKAGVHVEATIEEVDEHTFVVHYVRSKDIGVSAGASKHGVGANFSGGSSDFEKGSRTFASKKEAEEFKEKLPHELKEEPDPRSVAGAMKLKIGESRGMGNGVNEAIGASGTVEGATASVGHHDSDSSEVDVKRVSETIFEVTFLQQSTSGHNYGVGGLGTNVSRDRTDDDSKALTMRFDLGNAADKRAFEQFCSEPRVPPRGGQVVSQEKQKGKTNSESVGMWGDSDQIKNHTSETTRTEGKNQSKEFEGDQSHEHKAGWVGKHIFSEKDEHSSVEIDARQQNGKVAGYGVTAHIGGESGAYNRGKMDHMLNSDESFDKDKVERSGEWTMSSDLDAKQIAGMERYKQRFQGKSQDDKMRALSQWIADDGMNAIDTMQQDWGVQMNWDLELKGDKNFPGRAGREQLEARIQQYGQTLAAHPGGAAAVLAEVQGEIEALGARRKAVESPSNYTDLPGKLRAQQLQLIDREIATLTSLQHRAAVESTKSQPGESDKDITLRAHDDKAHAGLPEPQRHVAQLRDQIAMQDASVASAQKENAEAEAALAKAMKHVDWSKRDAGRRFGASGKLCTEARQLDQQQRAGYLGVDELRLSMLRSASDPAKEAQAAQELLARVTESAKQASSVNSKYYEAAKVQVLITRHEGLAGHDAFWTDVCDAIDTVDVADEIDGGAPGSGGAAGDDDDEVPRAHVGMALSEGKHKHR